MVFNNKIIGGIILIVLEYVLQDFQIILIQNHKLF